MKKCLKCGFENSDDSLFCNKCGEKLIVDSQNPASSNTQKDETQSPTAKNSHLSSTQISQTQNSQTDKVKKKNMLVPIIIVVVIFIVGMIITNALNSSKIDKLTFENNKLKQQLSATEAPQVTPAPKVTEKPVEAPVAKEFIKENYGYVDYGELARNPDNYKGKSLTYTGKVIQVMEGDNETHHRIAVGGNYDNVIYVGYPKNMVASRILDDDYVTVYGTSMGLYTYQSTNGGPITIPLLYLDRIEMAQ